MDPTLKQRVCDRIKAGKSELQRSFTRLDPVIYGPIQKPYQTISQRIFGRLEPGQSELQRSFAFEFVEKSVFFHETLCCPFFIFNKKHIFGYDKITT